MGSNKCRKKKNALQKTITNIINTDIDGQHTFTNGKCVSTVQLVGRTGECEAGGGISETMDELEQCAAEKQALTARLEEIKAEHNGEIDTCKADMLLQASSMIPKETVLKALTTMMGRYDTLYNSYNFIKNNLNTCNVEYNDKIKEFEQLANDYVNNLNNLKGKCMDVVNQSEEEKDNIKLNERKAIYIHENTNKNRWKHKFLMFLIIIMVFLIVLRLNGII